MMPPSQDSTIELHLASVAAQPHGQSDVQSAVLHLFDQLQPRLASYVVAFGLPRHDAEDIVQETFLSLFHHLQRDRPRWNLHGWLFKVAHNLALKHRAAHSVTSHVDYEDTMAQLPDPAENAEEQLAFAQRRQQLLAVFNALPERDRRCLQLRAEGLNYREIAKVLGISLGAVSLSLTRSLARMTRATGGE